MVFPIESVREVLRVGHITEVPQAPSYVLGIFSLRDALLPVVDIRKLFGSTSLVDDIVAYPRRYGAIPQAMDRIPEADH